MFESEFGEPLTETKIVTKIHAIAKKYGVKTIFNINNFRHMIANLIHDKEYSDVKVREICRNMGTSLEVLKRSYTDKKDTGFDVDVLVEPKNSKKQLKKKK